MRALSGVSGPSLILRVGLGACGVGDGHVCEMSGPLGVRNCGQR